MQNYVENMWYSLFLLQTEKPFSGKSGQKNKIFQFKLKFGNKINLNKWNSRMMFTFSVFDHRYLSWANLVRKFKIVCSKLNLIQRLIRIVVIFYSVAYFIYFRLKIATLFAKFGPKNRNCQLKLKIGIQTNSNLKILTVMFIFYVFGRKDQECLLKLKLRTQINLNMQNSMAMFILFSSEIPFLC